MNYRLRKLPAPIQVLFSSWSYWWDDLTGLLFVSIIWALCWLTVILGPPATFGLFQVAYDLVGGESTGLSGLYKGAKHYFLKSWLWMGLNILVFFVLLNAINYYTQANQFIASIIAGFLTCMLVTWVTIQFYTIPFIQRQEDESFRLALRNSLFTTLASPIYTLVLALIAGGLLAISILTIVPIFLGAPVFVVILQTNALKERITTFQGVIDAKDSE